MESIKKTFVTFWKSEGRPMLVAALRAIADTIEGDNRKTSKR
ncbi:hypothetical protein ACQKDD_16600 [Planococcus kocurii]